MYKDGPRTYAYEPVLREVEALASVFSRVTWMGARTARRSPDFAPILPANIDSVLFPRLDYPRWNTWQVLASIPEMLRKIREYTVRADRVHTRGPSHPAALSLWLSTWGHRPSWHKYAGDWLASSPPRSYAFQRNLLLRRGGNRSTVTVNARRAEDPDFIKALPNPCLWKNEWEQAGVQAAARRFEKPYRWIFAGTLMESKGIFDLLRALKTDSFPDLDELVIAGRGPLAPQIQAWIDGYQGPVKVQFRGALNRTDLNEAFGRADFLVLPSRSEGFPKVVAEAAAMGCIPLIPAFPSLQDLWKDGEQAFLLDPNRPLFETWQRLRMRKDLPAISQGARRSAAAYTYEKYLENLARYVFPASV